MRLPVGIESTLRDKFNIVPKDVYPCVGGDINHAAQIATADGLLFIKWNENALGGMFTAESKGLKLLRDSKTLRVPEVIALQEAEGDTPTFLVLEWLETGQANLQTPEQLGQGLAALHRQTAPKHGLDHDNFIGSLPQSNSQHDSWVNFYAEQRIRPQMEIARQKGMLRPGRERMLEVFLAHLPKLIQDAPASLLHGDLWGGNVMILANQQPAIIDPAVYYGNREVELAFTELFGGFAKRFYDAYHAAYPLEPGYPSRRALYQLYPLLVHMNLFGGGYASRVDSILSQYVG